MAEDKDREELVKQREMNFELLRVLAMCMIIGLHYLDKGGILGDFRQTKGMNGCLAWVFEAFFFSSVNVYVLISGYFLAGKETGMKRIVSLWGQVFFYAMSLGAVAFCTGMTEAKDLNLYRAAYYVFPVLTEHYWFVTDYVILCLLLPLMNPALSQMEQKKMKQLLAALVGIFCVAKSVLPLSFAVDKKGYDVLWFVCLYITGVYFKRFGFGRLSSKGKGIGVYVLSSAMIWLSAVLLKAICGKTGHFRDIVTYSYSYNYIFCYLAAIGLFACFSNISIKSEGAKKWTGILGSASFGVYLIHEHIDFRYVWQGWIGAGRQAASPLFPALMCGSILVVFLVCAGIELARKRLFLTISRRFRYGKKNVVQ